MGPKKGQVILRGWADIAEACGVTKKVMKRIAGRYGMPHVRLNGKVTVSRMTLVSWVDGLCRVVAEEGGRDEYVLGKLRNLGKRGAGK